MGSTEGRQQSEEAWHGVSFQEVASVLGDVLSITYPDPDHSVKEHRFITVGMSRLGRVLNSRAHRPQRKHSDHQFKKNDTAGTKIL